METITTCGEYVGPPCLDLALAVLCLTMVGPAAVSTRIIVSTISISSSSSSISIKLSSSSSSSSLAWHTKSSKRLAAPAMAPEGQTTRNINDGINIQERLHHRLPRGFEKRLDRVGWKGSDIERSRMWRLCVCV